MAVNHWVRGSNPRGGVVKPKQRDGAWVFSFIALEKLYQVQCLRHTYKLTHIRTLTNSLISAYYRSIVFTHGGCLMSRQRRQKSSPVAKKSLNDSTLPQDTGIQHERKIKAKPFYVTARVKKEGVQALSLRSKAVHHPLFSRFSHIFRSFVVFFTAESLSL